MNNKNIHLNIDKHANLLYQILPSVYRERDENGDLEKYLKGTGELLDQVHQTLIQRYADIFPDSDQSFNVDSQSWILPYIAALFDTKTVAPDTIGQREEIANTIAWRKAKGTIKVVEQIAESIGQMEVVVHEGFKRVATTPIIGRKLLPAEAYGYENTDDYSNAFEQYQQSKSPDLAPMWARHPALKAGTVDLRCQGGAVATTSDNLAAITSIVASTSHTWRQSSLHGSQSCHPGHSILPMSGRETDWIPGYFDDPSVRTVDFRNPNWRQGQIHPRRILLFAATHGGFFNHYTDIKKFNWKADLLTDATFLEVASVSQSENIITIKNRSLNSKNFEKIAIQKIVKLQQDVDGQPLVWRFEGFIFIHTLEVESGRLELDRCALFMAKIQTENTQEPVLNASNCLINKIQVAKGLVQLQYCTVLKTTLAAKLNASDSIFNGLIGKSQDDQTTPGTGCVRYSSILPKQQAGDIQYFKAPKLKAVFYSDQFNPHPVGCGVLHPATPIEIANGAADGSEMGAYHHLHLLARQQAILKKLIDFMPTGMQAVIIPDGSLNQLPDEI
ncbi:MAG TPA: hypothetical protein ENJ41_03290 [Oceanospirillales bacterium]|nr:hypothetical protein [Oceanospirillales bacterium]